MMSPSIVLRRGRARGRAGQRRLEPDPLGDAADGHPPARRGEDVADAVVAPRLHFEDGVVQAEPGFDEEDLQRLEERGYGVARWSRAQRLLRRGPRRGARPGDGRARWRRRSSARRRRCPRVVALARRRPCRSSSPARRSRASARGSRSALRARARAFACARPRSAARAAAASSPPAARPGQRSRRRRSPASSSVRASRCLKLARPVARTSRAQSRPPPRRRPPRSAPSTGSTSPAGYSSPSKRSSTRNGSSPVTTMSMRPSSNRSSTSVTRAVQPIRWASPSSSRKTIAERLLRLEAVVRSCACSAPRRCGAASARPGSRTTGSSKIGSSPVR